jgi:hypothetical protein
MIVLPASKDENNKSRFSIDLYTVILSTTVHMKQQNTSGRHGTTVLISSNSYPFCGKTTLAFTNLLSSPKRNSSSDDL